MIAGVGVAAFHPEAARLVRAASTGNHATTMSFFFDRWSASGVLGGLAGGWLADRLGHRKIIIFSFVLMAAAILLISQRREPAVILVCIALVGFCLYAPFSVMVVLGQEYFPNQYHRVCAGRVARLNKAACRIGDDPHQSRLLLEFYSLQSSGQLHWFAMRSASEGFGPGFLACDEGRRICQALVRDQSLERGQPMVIVARTVIGLTAAGGCSEFVGEGCRPFFPGEMPLLRKLDRERERLGLPRLGKHSALFISRQAR